MSHDQVGRSPGEIPRIEGVLVLEDRDNPANSDGVEFPGYLFGAPVTAESIRSARDRGYGEVVFNTSMTGYQEILTDPSYYGEIIVMTTPHIGNTGTNAEDVESAQPWCAGFVVNEATIEPSNWRSTGGLDDYLKTHKIPGIYGIDTRALTRRLRTQGVVRGIILPRSERAQAKELLKSLPPFEGRDMIGEVTTREPYVWNKSGKKGEFKIVAMDFGIKWNLLRSLENFGCQVEVVPADTSARDILSRDPDGVFLSNGPGDPSAAPYAAKTVKELVGQVPIFGVCMGHQILALAMGAKTFKMKFGHRGGNQPVIDNDTQRVEISSHNHGYAVDGSSLPPQIEVTHVNLNDRTIEGLRVIPKNGAAAAFSVQYHPEACPGPHDSVILFERFIKTLKEHQEASKKT